VCSAARGRRHVTCISTSRRAPSNPVHVAYGLQHRILAMPQQLLLVIVADLAAFVAVWVLVEKTKSHTAFVLWFIVVAVLWAVIVLGFITPVGPQG
jgi:hypothetical protein